MFKIGEKEILKLISSVEEIDGKIFMFSKRLSEGRDKADMAFAFVKEKDQNLYKLTFFRKSGSDRQWKSISGIDKNGRLKKGDEDSPRHHYVQSGKILPDIEKLLEKSEQAEFQIKKYLPRDGVFYDQRLGFKETYYEFKNPILKKEFEKLLELYRAYMEATKNNPGILPKIFERISNNIKHKGSNQIIRNILEAAQTSFEPDFSKSPFRTYVKGDIKIEEYEVSTPEGDNLVYAMACDSLGRVYIDNIYDKSSGITPYGTYSKFVNAGMLVYKPEDYIDQTFNIPGEFRLKSDKESSNYIDIADMFSLIPVVKRYRESLQSRGVFVRPLKSQKT